MTEQNDNVPMVAPLQTGLVLMGLLTSRQDRLKSSLEGTGISADRFIAGVVQAVAKNEALLQCTRESVLMACLESAQIGLEPTGLLNQAWLVPYKRTARLMIGYAGLITLLDRSGSYDFIEANLVYANDEFDWRKGTDPRIDHQPAEMENRGAFGHARGGGYWVAWKRGSTRPQFDVLSFAEMEKRRRVSKRAEQDMWAEWPEEMYRKTVLRWGLKSMPLTPTIQRALAYEQESLDLPDDHVRAAKQAAEDSRRARLVDQIAGHTDEAEQDAKPDAAEAEDDGLPDLP